MAGEKYTNIGKARWENANVGVIKWDPKNKAGLASVIDEATGTVYEIGGGGGGGESDFSTAQVTVVAGSEKLGAEGEIANVAILNGYNEELYIAAQALSAMPDDPATYTVVLYKGEQLITLFEEDVENTSGAIELSNDGYIIKGNCTITLYMPIVD